jgi:hypothetical protein
MSETVENCSWSDSSETGPRSVEIDGQTVEVVPAELAAEIEKQKIRAEMVADQLPPDLRECFAQLAVAINQREDLREAGQDLTQFALLLRDVSEHQANCASIVNADKCDCRIAELERSVANFKAADKATRPLR